MGKMEQIQEKSQKNQENGGTPAGRPETVTLELTPREVLVIRELIKAEKNELRWKEIFAYQWMRKLVRSLEAKAEAAYRKPVMSAGEHAELLEQERNYWRSQEGCGERAADAMVHGMDAQLHFLYEVEE